MHDDAPLRARLLRRDTEALLDRWRGQRRRLTTLLGYNAFPQAARRDAPPLEQRVGLLCQSLLDYLSAGHFAVFARLLDERSDCADAEPLRGLYRMIECTTDHALRFNDKYDTDPASLRAESSLPRDLSRLRRVMGLRFQLEEQWVEWVVESGDAEELPDREAPAEEAHPAVRSRDPGR